MKKGENKMKKLMILAAVAAMASGAWADPYTYQFNYSISHIPQEYQKLSSDARFEVWVGNECIAYVTMSEFGDYDWVGGWKSIDHDGETYGAGTRLQNVPNSDGTKKVDFEMTIKLDNATLAKYQNANLSEAARYGGAVNPEDGLKFVLYDPGTQEGYFEYRSETVAIGYTAQNTTSTSFSGDYTYAVPEPTSAMLLLLGFAGLALKRKQVA